jgi:periplasmic divalent cation tolerance protein
MLRHASLDPDDVGSWRGRRRRRRRPGLDELVILYTTWPDAETAEAVGRLAVEERLAACANVLAPMRSIYRWEGEVLAEAEVPMLLKTTTGAAERLARRVRERHPYAVPCILALPTVGPLGDPGYLAWARSEVA